MTQTDSLRVQFDRIQNRSLIVGALGLVLCLVGLFFNPDQFFQSYLFAYLFWLGMGLGCLAIVMVHHLTSGAWGVVMRRLLESGAMTLPLMALLFIPLAFGLSHLYIWARPEAVAADEALQHKSAYLNVPFFLVRAAFYFIAWAAVAFTLNRWSLAQDRIEKIDWTPRLKRLSAGGLLLFGLTVTFAMIDWVMSLEPHWYSTIYSAMVATGLLVEAFAFVIVLVFLLSDREPLAKVMTERTFNDLGSLLFAFIMLWAYMAFSQFLLIWSGNLSEEIPWYLSRLAGGWKWVALAIVLFHFALPFALLVSRDLKRNARLLTAVAALLLLMRLVDMFWLVMPAFYKTGLHVHWLDLAAAVGIGGIWIAAFIWWLKDKPLLPLHGPSIKEVRENG